ncbi:TonB-dependent receptor [Chryseolinea sp. T2]|uniref:TonB-dependent receptor n=1 Tax=Chryseolinea sp. T2 TaxID=3129255 RepID=UPI003078219D
MKFNLLFSILVLTTRLGICQTGSLAGTITDASKTPVHGATLILLESSKNTSTNELGFYQFVNIKPGTYTIEISYVGFQSVKGIIQVRPGDQLTQNFELQESDVQLDEVVVTAPTANDQQLITAVDVNLRPINNSQEILRMVPGLFIGQHAGGGKAEQIFLRGFDLDHGTDIKISVDGMPVNMVSHAHGQGYADLHFVIPELIQGVDFKKGPYRSDKGNQTTAGWIDFRIRNTLDQNLVKFEVGQFDTYRLAGAINLLSKSLRVKNQSAYIASEYSYSNSYFDNPQHFKRLNLIGKYNGKISHNTSLTFTASTFWSKWNHSGQIPDRAVASGSIGWFGSIDPTEGGETGRTNINTQFVTLDKKNNVIKNQLYYTNYDFQLYSNFTFFLHDSINGDQIRQKERRHLFGYNGSFTNQGTLFGKELVSTYGINYRQDLTRHTELSHTVNRNTTLERNKFGNINEANLGFYIDELIELSDHLSVNAGLRLDYFSNQYEDLIQIPATTLKASAHIVSPKLNFYYTLNSGTQFYFNTGKSFHSNDTRVVIAEGGKQILPAAYGSDLGIIFKPVQNMLVNASAWYLWLAQEFVYVGDEGIVEPSGKTRRQGIDVSIRYQIAKSLYADVDFNTTRPRAIGEPSGANYLPLAPVLTTTGGLTYSGAKGFSGSLRYRYMADRPANEDNTVVAKGYFILDAQLNYALKKSTFGISIQNVLNRKWKETQFDTESRLKNEIQPVEEIHFTPGTPFFAKASWTFFF